MTLWIATSAAALAQTGEAGSWKEAAAAEAAADADGTIVHPYLDFEAGKIAAQEQKKPLLVLFRTEDCAFTRLFLERTVPDPSVQAALSDLVVASIDVGGGKGKFIGKMHEVKVTPTFVIYDPVRGPLHQWKGWGQVAFLQNLGGGLRSDTPVVERLKRFETAPTAEDAALLGFFHASTGNFAASYPAFRKAEELNPEFDFTAEAFDAAAAGYGAAQISLDGLRAAADQLTARTESPEEIVNIASMMASVTERVGTGEQVAPYLRAALEKGAGTEDREIRSALDRLEPYRLLYLESDPDAAVAAYQKRFPGWPTSPDALNNVAWWCSAHRIHLADAEGWARKAVSEYSVTDDRANARDTLAEILVLRGKKKEAVEQLFKAFEEAPHVQKYAQKLKDFGEVVETPKPPEIKINADGTQP